MDSWLKQQTANQIAGETAEVSILVLMDSWLKPAMASPAAAPAAPFQSLF